MLGLSRVRFFCCLMTRLDLMIGCGPQTHTKPAPGQEGNWQSSDMSFGILFTPNAIVSLSFVRVCACASAKVEGIR